MASYIILIRLYTDVQTGIITRTLEDFVIECISGGRFSDANPACKGGNGYW